MEPGPNFQRKNAQHRTIYTVGHSTRPLGDFIDILRAYAIRRVVDVRTIPRSRANPQFNQDTLHAALSTAAIEYLHAPALGGLRHSRKDSVNAAWRNRSFRGFADYMQTPEFGAALVDLIDLSAGKTTAIMCAEALPWRCHRSLIADALVARGIPVVEIFNGKSSRLHALTPFATMEGTRVSYPAPSAPEADGPATVALEGEIEQHT